MTLLTRAAGLNRLGMRATIASSSELQLAVSMSLGGDFPLALGAVASWLESDFAVVAGAFKEERRLSFGFGEGITVGMQHIELDLNPRILSSSVWDSKDQSG